MTKEELIQKIILAFKDLKLEDGIGLWEGQGLDDYATPEECKKLREKDEKDNCQQIPVVDLYKCSSSLSFFDAKGMRFHLAPFLLSSLNVFKVEEDQLRENGLLLKDYPAPDIVFTLSSEIVFTLTYDLESEYNIKQFSLLNTAQLQCIIHFLEYKQQEMIEYYQDFYFKEYGTDPSAVYSDEDYLKLEEAKQIWKKKLES